MPLPPKKNFFLSSYIFFLKKNKKNSTNHSVLFFFFFEHATDRTTGTLLFIITMAGMSWSNWGLGAVTLTSNEKGDEESIVIGITVVSVLLFLGHLAVGIYAIVKANMLASLVKQKKIEDPFILGIKSEYLSVFCILGWLFCGFFGFVFNVVVSIKIPKAPIENVPERIP